MRIFILLLMLLNLSFAQELSDAKKERLVKRGEKISSTLCQKEKLDKITHSTIEELLKTLKTTEPCGKLSSKNQKALAYFLLSNEDNSTSNAIDVPSDAKCPVCGMFVSKYPKWSALMTIKGKENYFDGVKDMMKYYIFDADFPYKREDIEKIEVTNFYTLERVNAKEAFYVLGSDIYGPMGNELVPFATQKEAENFKRDHKGEQIVTFKEITAKMVMALDGIEL